MDRITFNPDQCGGRPCIRGMRTRVKDILDLLATGVNEAEALADFPYLEKEDIRAVLAFAAEEADHPARARSSPSRYGEDGNKRCEHTT
jgi:uncharacterized protein (DUF433 family)